jgi:hypothetical protein
VQPSSVALKVSLDRVDNGFRRERQKGEASILLAHLSRKRQVVLPLHTGREGETRKEVAKIVERVEARYEVQDVEMGKVYRWRPERVVVECECGSTLTLTASKQTRCGECGADHRALVEEVGLEAHPEDEVEHPWRSLRPYYTPVRGA